ncbi:MAG TPA: divalent-cation tolerance protein CutA [Thermodesulfovibrionales bacterium]|nr:divalent-cation tolerance protein CutA [Thermodesulfovibrionales bacterium]
MESIVVLITASSEDEAAKLSHVLVEERLAGCVNIIKGIRSIYQWQGKIEDESEVLMVIKTRRHLFAALSKKVREFHTYAVPEILAVPIVEGSAEYLTWLREVTG